MAEVLVHTIQFIGNNPYGTYVTGDVVTIYYDPDLDPSPALFSTTGYSVKKNGVVITSGPDIFYQRWEYKTETNHNAHVCNGTTLVLSVRQIPNFPYVFSYIEPGEPSCAVDPDTCDLIIVGTAGVVPASGETEADGEINIIAESSNEIEFKLHSDFLYGDGTAQPTGNFLGLAPGQYRVYVRDSRNCAANILVDVGFDDTYGPVYRLEYDDIIGGRSKVEILKRAYSGSVTEVKGGNNSSFFRQLRGEGSKDKFESILSTQGTLRLASISNFQFQQVYSNSPEEYRMHYYKFDDAGTAGFTPAVLPPLSSWSNISGAGVNWNPATQEVNFSSVYPIVESDLYHTPYTFDVGQSYSFAFSFTARNIFGGNSIGCTVKIKIVNSSYATLLEKVVSIPGTVPQNVSGDFNLVAPVGATGIAVYVYLPASVGSYFVKVDSFVNNTQSIPGTSGDFVLKWKGRVLPQQYQEEYTGPPYYIDMVASDGLPMLKEFVFLQDDGQRFNESIKQIKVIAFILSKTKLNLPIRVACNLYATGMNSTDLDDPLDQAYIDTDVYYLINDEPTLDFVLRAILEPYGARIVQENGRWNIVRVEEMKGPYDYRDFDKDGNVFDEGTYDPIVEVKSPSLSNGMSWSNTDQHMELCPGYGKIMLYYNLGLRDNVLENGDFRLKSVYDAPTTSYRYSIDKFGFQLVNGGYSVSEGYERVSEFNVAYRIESPLSITTGQTYLQSESYNIKMGAQNNLRIVIRFKVPKPPSSVLYQKLRVRVKYGTKYLQSTGLWSTTESELIFFFDKFDEYTEVETLAQSPDTGAASGYNFDIRVYHSYPYHADYTDFNSLIAVSASAVDALPVGTKVQVKTNQLNVGTTIYYYEVENANESSELEAINTINNRGDYNPISGLFPTTGGSGGSGSIRRGDTFRISSSGTIAFGDADVSVKANDKLIALTDAPGQNVSKWGYNFSPPVVTPTGWAYNINENQWRLKGIAGTSNGPPGTASFATFAIDFIKVQFLVNGVSPFDTIVREIKAEPRNRETLEKTVYHGSYSNVIQTININDLKGKRFARFANTVNSIITSNVLSADLIYSAYLRSSAGAGYSTWTRDGVSESSSLHAILLQTYAAQYKRAWRKISGSLYSKDTYMSFLSVLKETFDNDRLYIPIALTIDDRSNSYSGEFLELMDFTASAGSDGSGNSPFTSGFTIGFGSSYN